MREGFQEEPDLRNLSAAAYRCHPFAERLEAFTFRPNGDPVAKREQWELWMQEAWAPAFEPFFEQALPAARKIAFRELMEFDQLLGEALPESLASRSTGCAAFLLGCAGAPRGDRVLEKLHRHRAQGHSVHLATLHAARCAAFHFSDAIALSSYLFLEAAPIRVLSPEPGVLAALLARNPAAKSDVPVSKSIAWGL